MRELESKRMFLIPLIEPRDYAPLKKLCPDLPDSYEEWCEQQLKEQQRCESQEKTFLKVAITPAEFANYYKAANSLPNLVTFRAFVASSAARARK
jgi:hypothetical protein